MNKFYKVVFCKTTGVMKAVSETAKSGKKTKSISIAAGVLATGVMLSTTAMAAAGDPVLSGETTDNSIAVGVTNTATGNNSTAVGHDNSVVGDQSATVGTNNEVIGTNHTIIGHSNQAGNFQVGGEQYNSETGEWEYSFTNESFDNNTVVGNDNSAQGNSVAIVGQDNKAVNDRVTLSGSQNHVDTVGSGAYGQGNLVGTPNVAPQRFFRADNGIDAPETMRYRYGLAEGGSYAYGNHNQAYGDQNHTVGNENRLNSATSGVLGNNNNLSNQFYEEPMFRSVENNRSLSSNRRLSSNGSFLVGNSNDVDGNNTHAMGNANRIYAERNVTLGNNNSVEVNNLPDRFGWEGDGDIGVRAGFNPFPIDPNKNSSTAIVGEGNRITQAGVHILGTDNEIDQDYAYVVGAGNSVRSPDSMSNERARMGGERLVGFFPDNERNGSNVIGSANYLSSINSSVLGNRNSVENDSLLAVVTGSQNNIEGVSTSTVGNNNQIRKDVGGAHGTMNRVQGNAGALRVLEEALEAYNNGEVEVFEGLDLDGDGVIDFADPEEFMMFVNKSGSYAYGNINNLKGEAAHAVGNDNEFSGDSNKGLGNSNRIGQVGGMVGNSDAVLPTVNFDGSATYGDFNVVNADSAQTIGNENVLGKEFSSVTGYNNSVVQGLSGELVDVTIEQRRIAGTFVSGNDNLVESHGGVVSGSGNEFQADRATLSGSENIVIGDEGHVVGNDNEVYGNSNNGFGNNNVIGKVMNGDYSSVDSSHVVGNSNTMEGNASSAFGNDNTVSGDESTVVGLSNTTDGEGSLILGNYNENQSSMTTMIGGYNTIDNDYSDNTVTVGHNNRLSGNQATTIGNNNSIEKDASGAIGVENYIAEGFDRDGLAGEGLAGMGDGIDYNKYIERGSYAQGNKNDVRGDTTHVYGYRNAVLGNKASVVGANNSVSGNGAQVIGNDNLVGYNNDGMPQYGDNIAVLGSNNSVEAENSFVVGNNSTVDRGADGSLVFGSNASSSVAGGVAIGNNSVADRENAVSVGSAGAERQITNVADATETKDAVNLGQLNASLRDTTSGKNVTATRTDTGYEVALNDAITLDSVTTGSTVVDTNGVKVGDVTVSNIGLDNAGNRVTSVGDATLRSDAVNYGQFTDGLAGTIKSVTGDENIIATTDAEKNVSLVLNKDLVADSLTAGDTVINNAGFTNGATTLGNTGLKVGDVTVSSAGLDNAGNRVTNVGDAIENSDAVNYGQFKAGLTDTTAGKNIAVKRTDTGYEVSTVDDMTLTSMTAGDTLINNAGFTNGATTLGNTGLKVGDVTVSSVGLDNAGNRVTSVGDATLRSDAVNYGQFTDGLAGTIKSVTGDENITATTDAEKNVSLVLKKDITVDSMTAGNTVINDAGFTNGATTLGNTGLKVGDVTVSSAGLDNAGNRVTSVGNAIEDTDAVNYGQFKAGITDTTAGKNIAVKRTDTGYEVSTVEDMTLTSVKTGDTLINNAGFTNGATTVGGAGLKVGDVTVSNVGLDNAGNRVTSVGDATLRSDAVNYGQFTDGLAGTIKSVTGDENITATTDAEKNVSLVLNRDLDVDSVTAGSNVFDSSGLQIGGVTIGDEVGIYAGDMRVRGVADAVESSDAVNLGQVSVIDDRLTNENIAQNTIITNNTNAINKGFNVGNGVTSNKFELGDTVDITAGKNSKVTTTDTGVEVSVADDLVVTTVTTGNTLVNTDGVRAGDVFLSATTGLDNAGNRVTSVGDGEVRSDAVNYGQFTDGLAGTIKSVTGDENITATTDANKNVSLVLNKDIAIDSMTAGDTLINNAGFTNGATTVGGAGLKVGDVTVSNVGLDNAGNRVTSVGDGEVRSDAVNYGQFTDGLAGTIKSVTGDENITATTDANKNVSLVLNKDVVIDSMTAGDTLINNAGFTNGATTLGNAGLKVGDVTVSNVGLDNAGNRVTSVGDAIVRSDAVNYGQFQDGLDGTIKSVTGDENITATTDANKNVSLVLNKDITVDSVMAGSNVFNTNGLNVGSVNISNESGIYAGNKKVSGVADATNRDDAVNYGQFQDGLNGLTKTTVDGDENITSTKNATGYDVTLNKDVKVDSVTAGNTIINNDGFTNGATTVGNTGLKVGDVTVSSAGLDNAGNRVTSVGDANLRSDAVNYGQFTDGLAGTIKSVTGDENITATTDANKNVSLVLNKDITVDSMTAGDTIINNAGFTNGATTLGNTGLKVGDVTVSSVGLDNAGNRVTSVGDATLRSDAVNYGQFTDGLAGTIKSVTGDENIIATTDAEKNVTLNLKKDILVDSMTAGDTIVNSDGMTIGNTFYGSTGVRTGDVILSNTSGLYNAGYRVTGVGRAVEGMDAVNFDQFNEALNKITPTTIDGDKNITVTNKGTGYDIALNDNLTADSVTTGGTTVNNDGLTAGNVTVGSGGLSNGGNRVTNIGDAVEGSDAVSFDQFNKKFDSIVPTDIKGDKNITVTKTDNGFDIGLNKDITADSVTVGNTSITSDGLTVGNVTVGAGGLNNGGNTVKGVGDGVLRDDAVNKGQLDDLEVRQNIKNEAQDIIINNKLDRDEFLKDQERQDALLEGKADKAELEKTNANVSNNTTNINKHSDILEAHDKELGRLEDVKADKAELDKTNIKVQDNADKNKDQDKTLGEHKTELDRLEDVKADKKDLEAKADKTYVDKEITATNDRFSEINKENNSKFERFEKAQSNIDSSQNVRIDRNEQAIADLGYQVDNLEGKLSAGIASSVAMASMPSSFIKGEARIAGGFGYYNGQNAIAIGITGATETGDYSYKLGSSYTQEGGAVVGAGISYRLW